MYKSLKKVIAIIRTSPIFKHHIRGGRKKNIRENEEELCEILSSGRCGCGMLGLTEAVAACTRSSQLKSSIDREGVLDVLPFTEELLSADSCLGKKSNVLQGMCTYGLVDCHAPVCGHIGNVNWIQ